MRLPLAERRKGQLGSRNSLMHLESVTFHADKYPAADVYPFNISVFRETKRLVFAGPITFFVGENGSGKSTLLEALARKCDIHIWRDDERRRFENNPYEDRLSRFISVEWTNEVVPGSFFGSSTFQDFARILDDWAAASPALLDYFGGKSLLTQSHGQSMMSFFRARYGIKGLYLLDEPETALSPKTQIEMLKLLTNAARSGHAQFIIATHSPILLACSGAAILSFDHTPVAPVEYEETDHYKIFRDFMRDRCKFLE
jgi:predicted ATPase